MPSHETGLGGPDRAFRTTIWTDILSGGEPASLDRLIRRYWKPVYTFIRISWHKNVEDAKDLTQAFFARFLEKEYWNNLDPQKGSFRGYLKRALHHFLINARKHDQVRTPEKPMFSFEASREELRELGATSPDETPEQAYDRQWFICLMDATIEQLGEHLRKEKKDVYLEVFQIYCLDPSGAYVPPEPASGEAPPPGAPTYGEIAKRLGIQETDVRNYLTYCRRAIRRMVRDQIRDYVSSDEEVDQELREAARR